MSSFIIVERDKKLSGVYTNDIPKNWFSFRKNDWLTYSSREEAKEDINYFYNEATSCLSGDMRAKIQNRILNFSINEVTQ
jgi:hypothetical protein